MENYTNLNITIVFFFFFSFFCCFFGEGVFCFEINLKQVLLNRTAHDIGRLTSTPPTTANITNLHKTLNKKTVSNPKTNTTADGKLIKVTPLSPIPSKKQQKQNKKTLIYSTLNTWRQLFLHFFHIKQSSCIFYYYLFTLVKCTLWAFKVVKMCMIKFLLSMLKMWF